MRGFYRTFAGPVIIGVSVWCATGTLAVLSNADHSVRLGAAAPWWTVLVAAIAAACVPGWRRRPATALPALASTLPWWPLSLPAIALIWTGPLAWAPIAVALLVAEGSRPLSWIGRAFNAHEPARATWLAAIASLLIGLGAAWAADPRVPGGDEPHYLVITQSLLKDGDLQIENNHASRDYASYFGGTINPDYLARGSNGAIYSIHAPGVSALVLPAFALSGFRGAQATVIILFAIAGAFMWRAAWRLTGDASAAWFSWAAVAGSSTMAVLSFMIFPETPGACAVAAGVWLLVAHRDASSRSIIVVSAALAALPWLHTRFSVLAGAIGIAIVVSLVTDVSRSSAVRWRRVAQFMAIPVLSAVAWLSMFHVLYGTVDPRAPYGPNPEIRSWIWGAVTGLFVDQQFGLLTYAPVLCTAFLGIVFANSRSSRVLSVANLGIVLVYAMAVASYWMWWAGVPGLPARFLTAALPLLVLPLAIVWVRSSAGGRSLLLSGLAVSLAITLIVIGVNRSAMAWNPRDGQAAWLEWLSPVVNLPRAWPSFFWNGEGAFIRHAALFIVMVAIVCIGARFVAARQGGDQSNTRLRIGSLLLLGFMAIVGFGWTVTATAPLDPARAQLAIHEVAGSGRAVWQIGSGIRRWDPQATPLRIVRDQPPLSDRPTPVVLSLVGVPNGLYQLDIVSGNRSGVLMVCFRRCDGRSAPLQRLAVAASQPQSFPLMLPAGAGVLSVEAESADLARELNVSLVPLTLPARGRGIARQFSRYSAADVYFIDGNAFPEPTGFWVRGGRTTEVVLNLGAAAAHRPGSLMVRNGASANTVTIESDGWQEVLTLAAGEARTVSLPAADALGSWPLKITSASGFRPSETAGRDNRFLGVWVSF